jgi:hypothetical protein
MSSRPELKIDWATYEAAKYAVEHWHYSRTLSSSRNAYIGAWENEKFIGVVVFGLGSGGATNGTRYGLARSHEMAELTRIALSKHETPVSRVVKIAIQFIKRQSPGLRMIISMADPAHGHHGGIYQAGNWIYTGETDSDYQYQLPDGRYVHHRTASSCLKSVAGRPKKRIPGKYRYLMPLDDEMRKRIEPLRKPYPKRPKQAMESAQDSQREGSAHPDAPKK